MDTFTKSVLQQLKLIISLKMLHSEDEIKKIYQEVAKARTPGMMLEAMRKLPEGEIQIIRNILNKEEKIILRPLSIYKNALNPPTLSFKFPEKPKKHPRIEMLDRIKKIKKK